MSKKKEEAAPQTEAPEAAEAPVTPEAPEEAMPTPEELAKLREAAAAYAQEHDNYLRLAAEYDNFRKRSQKEKDSLYQSAQCDTVAKFLPVFDNLQRAINQPTTDEAYAKGVQLTASGMDEILSKLGVKVFGAAGDSFDPEKHSAVMHIEDEGLPENSIAEVFQQGFSLGDKVIRFAMVKVAN